MRNQCKLRRAINYEFPCFVAGEIIQVVEAMPGSVVPLAMFSREFAIFNLRTEPEDPTYVHVFPRVCVFAHV